MVYRMACRTVLLALVLVCALSAIGKKNAEPVYDQTGKVIRIPQHHDFSASYETRDGHYYSYTCDQSPGSIDCQESHCTYHVQLSSGAVLTTLCSRLPDRSTDGLYDPLGQFNLHRNESCCEANPVWRAQAFSDKGSFRLRVGVWMDGLAICIPYSVLDKHGKVKKQKEACYPAWKTAAALVPDQR